MIAKIVPHPPSGLDTFFSPWKTVARYDLDPNTQIITLEKPDHLLLKLSGTGSGTEYFMISVDSAERMADAILSILHGPNVVTRAPTVTMDPLPKLGEITAAPEVNINRIAWIVIGVLGALIIGLAWWFGIAR